MRKTSVADGERGTSGLVGSCPNRSSLQNASEAPGQPGWSRRLGRWWYVWRYYRTSQLTMRLAGRIKARLLGLTGGQHYTRPPNVLPRLRDNPGLGSWSREKLASRLAGGSASNAKSVAQGTYRFLNRPLTLSDPVDWRLGTCQEATLLWRFHLHYHEFLLDLAAEGLRSGEPGWFERAWQLAADWIDANSPSDGRVFKDAWHPYCISRRLPVWMILWSVVPPPEVLANRILGSIFAQARFLERHLEWDLRGNHLLENVRALLLVGGFLEGPDADRWLRTGTKIFRKQLAEQILPHGEHIERSPMYHAQMLEAVLDVRDVVGPLLPDLAAVCQESATRMAAFLQALLHPDEDIPLLGDACLRATAPPSRLIRQAGKRAPKERRGHEEDTRQPGSSPSARTLGDYWIYRHADSFLLLDAGPVGPDHLPAHAHADLLSFEASFQGHRLFVDSGVFGYEDDKMRRYCRSSAAHNVLQIDGHDQCDMWSRFRMGHRGWPGRLECGATGGFHWARATHNAYRRVGVPRVGRWLACRPGGTWLSVDWAEGKRRHELSNWLHLHPGVSVQVESDNELRLSIKGTVLRLRYLTPGRINVTTGWYCPEFGRRLECPVVQWTREGVLPSISGWYLTWDERDGTAVLSETDSGAVLLHWTEQDDRLQLHPVEAPSFTRSTH